jgi:hypothetical protein
VSKPKVRKSSAQNSVEVDAKNEQLHELRFTPLSSIPVDNPFHEKEMFEKGEDARKLNPEHCSGPVVVSGDARNRRIVEVYRMCYQAPSKLSRLKVISDFIAHFPHLIFDAAWLKDELTREDYALPDLGNKNKRELLRAISNGFRSATGRTEHKSALQKSYAVTGARMAMENFQRDLLKWNDALERGICLDEDIQIEVDRKANELIDSHWKLGKPDKQRLKRLLVNGQCYKAALYITSKVFGVRARDLQMKRD